MAALDAEQGGITGAETRKFGDVRRGYTAFANGDVILAKITPCFENGKAAVAEDLASGLGFGSSEFHVLRPSSAVLARYLFQWVRQPRFRDEGADHMTGTAGQARVPVKYLRGLEIPLPPVVEQERIVHQVEALLAQVSAARDRLAKVPLILKRFRQAVLAAACSGRLTDDWRERSLGSNRRGILRRIDDARRTAGIARPVSEPGSEFELPFPDEWPLVSLDRVASHLTSGSRAWKRYYRPDGYGTFVMAQNVRPLRFERSFRQGVEPPAHDPERERTRVQADDILVTIVGANTGDVCRVDVPVTDFFVCQSVALIRPTIAETAPFLELWLNSPAHGQQQFAAWLYGEGRPHLSFDQLRSTAIALPSLEEQAEIMQRVGSLFSLADAIERRVAVGLGRAERVPQAILSRAFSGELVPTEAELARADGRDYETASALLERIRRERERAAEHVARARPSTRRGASRRSGRRSRS